MFYTGSSFSGLSSFGWLFYFACSCPGLIGRYHVTGGINSLQVFFYIISRSKLKLGWTWAKLLRMLSNMSLLAR